MNGGGPRLLRARGLEVGYGSTEVLAGVDLQIHTRGSLGVLGPAGVGKSTLLKTLSRWNDSFPAFWWRGSVKLGERELLRDVPLAEARRTVALLMQRTQLLVASIADNALAERPRPLETSAARAERVRQVLEPSGLWEELRDRLHEPVMSLPLGTQRRLTIARLLAEGAQCLLADEPLRDLTPQEAAPLEALLRQVAEQRSLVLVTHDQREARRLCDRVALLVAGRIVEAGSARTFFSAPRTSLGRDFLTWGNCWPTEPFAPPAPPPEGVAAPPVGFYWVVPGLMGGMPQPGLIRPLEDDLTPLAALGCRLLVSLTENPETDLPEALADHGIDSLHLPIPDMGVPTLEAARACVERVQAYLDAGEPAVFHCRGGLGRTGTLLAATLVRRGASPVHAIETVRGANRLAIQTAEQAQFVSTFAAHLDAQVAPAETREAS